MADSLSERISVELARGQLDLSRGPTISAIPTPGEDIASLRKCIVAIKAALDAKSGRGGSAYDQWVSMRDLIDAGSVTVQVGGEYLGIPPIGGEVTDPDPRPFLSTPPTPSNLTAQGSYKHIILSWDLTTYRNHSYTEVWRATSDSLGAATAIAQATANLYADDTGVMGTTYYYWVRAIGYAEDGSAITGAYNGVGGTMGGLGRIGNVDLGPLIVEAGNLASDAVTATKIAANAVELTKFASGIEPVTVVSTVPGAFVTQTVYNTTNKKLYRWSGSAYVYDTPAADISGQLVAAQVALNIGGGNLLANSGFEDRAPGSRPAGYVQYNNGGISATYTIPTGLLGTAFGLQANTTSTNTFGLHTTNTSSDGIVVGGVAGGWKTYTTYMVSVWARKINGAAWNQLTLEWNLAPASVVGVSLPILSTTFQRYVWRIIFTSTVEPSGNLYISVGPQVTASGDVIVFDNLQIEEGDTVTAWAPKATEILPGTITTTMVADDAITTPKIIAGAIVTGKIAAGAVTANEIAANTITAGQIAANTITSAQIAADTITAGQIAAGAIGADEIAAGAIIAGKIAAGAIAVGSAAIENGAIRNALIANLAVDDAKIANGTISYAKIGSVDAGTITVGTLSAARIAAGSLSANLLTSGTITATQIASATITGTNIAASTITASNLTVTSLSSITATTGALSVNSSITIGSTGYVIGGQTDYNTGTGFFLGYSGGTYKFSIGNPSGPYMLWNGSNLLIKNATFESFSASIGGGSINHTTALTGYFNIGSKTATASGGTGSYSYLWSIINYSEGGGTISLLASSSATSATVGFTSYLPVDGADAGAYATCTVTDGNGRTASASFDMTSTNTS